MAPYAPDRSVDAVDAELAAGFRRLRFAPALETRFELDTSALRRRHLAIASLMGVALYDVFLFNDHLMVPDVFAQAILYRLGIFTPLALLSIGALASSLRTRLIEWCATGVSVLAVGLIMVLFAKTASPYKPAYQYGTAVIMIFVAVAQRLAFRLCLLAVAAMFVIQCVVLRQWGGPDPMTLQAAVTFHASVALLVLFTAYGLEREFRRSYLLRRRSRLLIEQLDRAARIDPLTGLFNRRHLNEIMAKAWRDAGSAPRPMAIILLDLDHFKIFNDTYGHLAGDECLTRVSACIRATFGEIAVRFGGEEFVLFLSNVAPEEAQRTAGRLRAAIALEAIPHPALGEGAMVSASIGIGTGHAPSTSTSSLLASADAALYAAKAAGRDCIRAQVAEPEPRHAPGAVAA